MTRDAFELALSAPIDPANPLHARIIRERASAAAKFVDLVARVARGVARHSRLRGFVERGLLEVDDLQGEGLRAVIEHLVAKGAKPLPDAALIAVIARRAMIRTFIEEPARAVRGGGVIHESLDGIYSALDGDDPYFVPVCGADARRIVSADERATDLEAHDLAMEHAEIVRDARQLLESFLRPRGRTLGTKLKERSLTKNRLAAVLLSLAEECGIDTRRARAAQASRGSAIDRNLRTNAVFDALLRQTGLGIGDDDHGDPPIKVATRARTRKPAHCSSIAPK